MCVFCLLTRQDFEGEGVLLLDGLREEEASVAAVVSVSIFGQDVGEVEVPVQTHGHPLILRDRSHSWKTDVSQGGSESINRSTRWTTKCDISPITAPVRVRLLIPNSSTCRPLSTRGICQVIKGNHLFPVPAKESNHWPLDCSIRVYFHVRFRVCS